MNMNKIVFGTPLRKLGYRYTGGLTIESAINEAKKLNEKGIETCLNHLGEHKTSLDKVNGEVAYTKKLLAKMAESKIRSSLSVKPTSLGLNISYELALDNIVQICEHGTFVWIDMEGSKHTQDTLNLYMNAREEFSNVGVVLQANLKRTLTDLRNLSYAKVRLVKGAYVESSEIAFQSSDDIDSNYRNMIDMAFSKCDAVTVATHDKVFLNYAIQTWQGTSVMGCEPLEVQMLRGIAPKMEAQLLSIGVKVVEYVPFGEEAFTTLVRRLHSARGGIGLVVGSIFKDYIPRDRKVIEHVPVKIFNGDLPTEN